ncbi:MFS transporter [Lactobacillaceae bacterium L1_55_11]|nr:MFS transporter [Lactobacillaceae bacterium L1_55_11]
MKKWLSLAFMLSIFICMLDTTILNIALPAISENLAVSLDQLSWALNAYTIAFASLTIPITRFAELFGQKRFFIAGALIFGMGSIVSGMAGQLSILILGRIIQSVGAATIFPLAMVLGLTRLMLSDGPR